MEKVQVVFSSKQEKYSISDTPILIPVQLKRAGLSQVINRILDLDPPVEFDFIINDRFLRTTIQNYLDSKLLSTVLLI